MKCGKCGTPFTAGWSTGKCSKHAYYFCRKRCGAPSVKAYEFDFTTVEYLRAISPTNECLDAFIALLRSTYYKRVAILKKRKDESDTELKRLYDLRQSLVEKNLSSVYSDEIFKEQNKIIEEQITVIQMTQDDALLEKYNLESIVGFMKEKLADLGKTYQESDISQIRVLLSSIFPSGLAWSYPDYSNTYISPLYQSIVDFETSCSTFGDPNVLSLQLFKQFENFYTLINTFDEAKIYV